MTVTSTRRVSTSLSYSSSVRGGYEAAQGSQSFVENIDTSNNVSIQNENDSEGRKYYQRAQDETGEQENFNAEASQPIDNGIKTSQNYSPLIDNDDDVGVIQNQNVGIYVVNQEKSKPETDRRDNPYVKHLYEHNEIVDEVDEFV